MINEGNLFAQYPQYFACDSENGLPGNEVYSIVQDTKGFIWIGCDAGLFKYDGVHYIPYICKTQNSKAITGLTLSASGRLYCFNFQSQIFCLEHDSLVELKHIPQNNIINNLVSDLYGNVYAAHMGGVSRYNEVQKTWKDFFKYSLDIVLSTDSLVAKSVNGSLQKEILFVYPNGIMEIADDTLRLKYKTDMFEKISAGKFEIENYENELWFFSKEGGSIFRLANNQIESDANQALNKLLTGRKITNVKLLSDNNFWICTYKGIVCFNPVSNSVELFYPELSFSDCIIDREHNYWFSTLQGGILRIPNLSFKVWNRFENNRLTKMTSDSTYIYFTSVSGMLGKIHAYTGELKTFYTGNNADVQSLDYDFVEKALYFNINNRLYKLHSNILSKSEMIIPAIKSFRKIYNSTFALSSQGVFINGEKISSNWARELKYNARTQTVWIATNSGLQQYQYLNTGWKLIQSYLPETQIISLDLNTVDQQVFFLTFDGQVYMISDKNNVSRLVDLPAIVQGKKILSYQNKLWIAGNKGIWIYDLISKQWNNLNFLTGLVSDNVQDFVILNHVLWMATGKGLQKIPLQKLNQSNVLAKIYLKDSISNFDLHYGDAIILHPEVSLFSSNGNFEYAYRINGGDWLKLPASIEKIEIQNLPAGNVEIELKAIDHLGRNSENIILLQGYVHPSFWETWWFGAGVFLVLILFAYGFYKRQLSNQQKELQRQNEVNIAKLTAIRSQMNPHFIFNSLNSIQDLILQKKTEESYDYVVLFSELVRNALNYSNRDFISIGDEVEFLNTYLQLEQLRFKSDFYYQIIYDEIDGIDVPSLMVQPFVENALFHGLLHKEGKKELKIRFTFDENILYCEIEDNGIGRKQAEIIRARQGTSHASFALEAIQKRMDIFNERHGKRVAEFMFEDLYPGQTDSGTRVVIRLPFHRHY